MPVDPVGATLASIALLFPVYDACDRLFSSCKVMLAFGRDIQLLYRTLDAQWVIFHGIMQRPNARLQDPLDPNDSNHRVTEAVKSQLITLETHFSKCEAIVKEEMRSSEIRLSSLRSPAHAQPDRGLPSLTSSTTIGTSESALTPEDTRQGSTQASRVDEEVVSSGNEKPGFLSKVKHPRRFFQKREEGNARPSPANQASAPMAPVASDLREGMEIEAFERMSISQISMQQTQSRTVQNQTSLWAHIKWAHHNMDLFKAKITEIRSTIADLEKLLALRDPQQPVDLLALASTTNLEEYSSEQHRDALYRLHSAFKALNHASKGCTYSFAVQVAARPAKAWEDIQEQTSLPLGDEGFIFYFQAQHLQSQSMESYFLMAETTKDAASLISHEPREGLSALQNLEGLQQTFSGSEESQFIPLGFISTHRNLSDRHHIFVETEQWRQVKTLADVIDENITTNGITQVDLIDLVEIILSAHIDFARVRETTPNPRAESFVYYREPVVHANNDDPSPVSEFSLLLPYLSNHFGQKRTQGRPGATGRADEKDPDAAIIELGLILFQLGTHSKISYPPYTVGKLPASLLKARADAKRDLNLVERHHGPGFATVVETCLSANGSSDMITVVGCLASLKDLRKELNRDSAM